MLEAADTIANYASRGRDAFDADPALRDGILYQIVVLGEAARAVFRAEPTLVAEVSEIEWSSLASMRDPLLQDHLERHLMNEAELASTEISSLPRADDA